MSELIGDTVTYGTPSSQPLNYWKRKIDNCVSKVIDTLLRVQPIFASVAEIGAN